MPKSYFTFRMGGPLGKYYRVIEADTYSDARSIQFEDFGDKWAFQYTEEGWVENGISQAEKYNLKKL